ncbi:MAG: DNA phosphorothioation-dependent restriction protein DptF [Pseudomonadales bacterium]
MRLRKALGMLSKSSPYAVSTGAEEIDAELEKIKEYLYVETAIERAFKAKLDKIKSNEIVFLCGSSGDGKSEILTRYRQDYDGRVEFHLDATHSFEPDMTAVETLDNIFSQSSTSGQALVVGINIGMLGNYEREGSDRHLDIKAAIKSFLDGREIEGDYTFIDFESFPKFQILDGEVESKFFSTLLENIVKDDSRNLFREYVNQAISSDADKVLVANILLLRDKNVQKTVIELLLSARVRKGQFITARMLLDFIYCVLTGPGYLFDNIFGGGDNELLAVISDFDPSIIRNREIDLFVVHRTLEFDDDQYKNFVTELASRFNVVGAFSPQSMIRCFYLLKNTSLENNYHHNFEGSFNEKALALYKNRWEQHRYYDGSNERKAALKLFYNDVVLTSINKYANRNAPYLSKDEFYISSHGDCDLAAEVDLAISYTLIEKDNFHDISEFRLHIKVNDDELPPVPVNVNLLAMMMDIVAGFRPNKHDKNSVVLLDDLVNKITEMASYSKVLFLYKNKLRIKLKNNPDGDIRVSGLLE